jgi:hypothetical protein
MLKGFTPGVSQEMHKMSQEHLVIPDSKEVIKSYTGECGSLQL